MRAGRTMAASRAMPSSARVSVKRASNLAISWTKALPAYPDGISNILRLQFTIAPHAVRSSW